MPTRRISGINNSHELLTQIVRVPCLARIRTPKVRASVNLEIAQSVVRIHFREDPCVQSLRAVIASRISSTLLELG